MGYCCCFSSFLFFCFFFVFLLFSFLNSSLLLLKTSFLQPRRRKTSTLRCHRLPHTSICPGIFSAIPEENNKNTTLMGGYYSVAALPQWWSEGSRYYGKAGIEYAVKQNKRWESIAQLVANVKSKVSSEEHSEDKLTYLITGELGYWLSMCPSTQ